MNKAQTQKLEQDDIEAIYACLHDWAEDGREDNTRQLFAFFNSGEHSGASQAHRHVQFIPVESMTADMPGKRWELLMTRMCAGHGKLPFKHFWSPLPQKPSAAELYQIYTKLHQAAASAVRDYIRKHPGELEAHDSNDGAFEFSYNLGITASAMIICPRRREGTALKADDGSEIGFAALNGTLLAGSMMVKHQEEWDYLRSKPRILDEILESIGIPSAPTEDPSNAKI
jgi:ATP adenylyltransferase